MLSFIDLSKEQNESSFNIRDDNINLEDPSLCSVNGKPIMEESFVQ